MKSAKTIVMLAALLFVIAEYASAMCFYNKTNDEIHVYQTDGNGGTWNIGPNGHSCTRGHEIYFKVTDGYFPFGNCILPKHQASTCWREAGLKVSAHGWATYCGGQSYTIYDKNGGIVDKGGDSCP